MLRSEEHGLVRYFALARSIAGRYFLSSGVYFVDGLLIDTGPSNASAEFASILGSVDAYQLLLTHHHEDHTGNAAFAANHLDRPPLAHPLAVPLMRKPSLIPFYRKVVWGSAEAVEAEPLTDELRTPNHTFRVIHTPGHAPDHIALYEPDEKWLFAGDLFLAPRLKVLRSDENVTELISSLRKLLELPDCTLFCQHSGAHASHQKELAQKLDFLLGIQHEAVVMHDEGRTVDETVRALKLEKPGMKFISRGEFSARNLVSELLRDAGVEGG